MDTLQGTHIYLRALEPEDLEAIYAVENKESLWSAGETIVPYSRFILKEYLANVHRDIFDVRQLRLAIVVKESSEFTGMVDIFDFDPHHLRAGLGVIVSADEYRRKGYAFEAINLVVAYCKKHLKMHQLYANIEEDNKGSISLFEKAGFECIGVKKDWRRRPSLDGKEVYSNEYLYQLIF